MQVVVTLIDVINAFVPTAKVVAQQTDREWEEYCLDVEPGEKYWRHDISDQLDMGAIRAN